MRKLVALSGLVVLIAATSTAQATTRTSRSTYSVASSKRLIRTWFGSNPVAWGTACRESGFTASATNYNSNGTIDRGLFQINSSHNGTRYHYFINGRGVNIVLNVYKLYRPRYNVRIAWAMSRGGTNWQPWNGGTTYCALGYN